MKDFIPCIVLAVLYLFFYHILETEASQRSEAGPLLGSLSRQARQADAVEARDAPEDQSLIDTISLSYGGNLYISETLRQGREIAAAMMSAVGSLVDMKMVRSIVDGVVERMRDREGRSMDDKGRGRADPVVAEEDENQEAMKEGITTLVGAALGEQQCWERTACKAGEYAATIPGKDVLFIVLDRLAPDSWSSTLQTIKQSATYIQDCNRFGCSTDPEDQENDA